ncbi:MAG: hypothetical protein J6N67_03085 [Desulfovibrio sp.]|nr:hypothetical protein [Desulfovibrio sp.]
MGIMEMVMARKGIALTGMGMARTCAATTAPVVMVPKGIGPLKATVRMVTDRSDNRQS